MYCIFLLNMTYFIFKFYVKYIKFIVKKYIITKNNVFSILLSLYGLRSVLHFLNFFWTFKTSYRLPITSSASIVCTNDFIGSRAAVSSGFWWRTNYIRCKRDYQSQRHQYLRWVFAIKSDVPIDKSDTSDRYLMKLVYQNERTNTKIS